MWRAIGVALLLAGCAQLETEAPQDQVFELSGRLAARQGEEAFTGNLSWRHAGSVDELLVTSPLGQGVARIVRKGDSVVLTTAEPREYRAPDVESLTEQALGFRRLLERRNTNQFMPFARRLYAAMFAPLEPLLAEAGVDTVVFIPDGPLRGLPVGALYDGKGFLVERFAFATAPGLTLVEPQAIAERDNLQILVNGITEAVQNFPALPYVGEEMESLKELLPKGRFLRDAQFRLPVFEEEVKGKPYSIVHIASHGEFGSDPKASFVLTYDGKLSMDNLEQVMKIARFRDDPIELLTLSACKTAAGDERAALGIAGVAVKAGARSALATLWYVSDEASSILVTDFYRRLPTTSKAKALQEAQRAVLADQRFRHPGYWAPFLLIGNWL